MLSTTRRACLQSKVRLAPANQEVQHKLDKEKPVTDSIESHRVSLSKHGSASNRVQPRVQSRLLRVFVLQLALISLLTVAGIFAASLVAERLLVNQALVGEANYFWQRRAQNPDFALPDTLNLQSWFSAQDSVEPLPEHFAALPIGQHRVVVESDNRIVHVSERAGERLYLLFQDETVSNLAFYFGVVPLTLVLLIMYSLAFLAYWLSKRAVSPIARLADVIERFDFNERDASELDLRELPGPRDSETVVLAQALEHFVERSKDSIERERNFTRYASHELRTPIAVIQGSVASLELVKLEGAAGRAVSRIKRNCEHMAQLIGSLLLLARDRATAEHSECVDVTELMRDLIDEVQLIDGTNVQLKPSSELQVSAPTAVLSIVLGNILRNACRYTEEGVIGVEVGDAFVAISDTGRGLNSEQQRRIFEPFYRVENTDDKLAATAANGKLSAQTGQGLGLGLAIVRHFCDIHSWSLEVESEPGKGSCFTVRFDR
ncbi:MAG: sensor histidine kinase [Granulosicoccus sp.]